MNQKDIIRGRLLMIKTFNRMEVFEFLDPTTGFPLADGTQHVICDLVICIKEADMSTGPCAPDVCAWWGTHDLTASINTSRRFG